MTIERHEVRYAVHTTTRDGRRVRDPRGRYATRVEWRVPGAPRPFPRKKDAQAYIDQREVT